MEEHHIPQEKQGGDIFTSQTGRDYSMESVRKLFSVSRESDKHEALFGLSNIG